MSAKGKWEDNSTKLWKDEKVLRCCTAYTHQTTPSSWSYFKTNLNFMELLLVQTNGVGLELRFAQCYHPRGSLTVFGVIIVVIIMIRNTDKNI